MTAIDQERGDFGNDIASLRLAFADSIWRGLALVAFFSVPITLLRVWATGWLPAYEIHLVLCVLTMVLSRQQARMSYGRRVGLLCSLLWVTGVPGLFTFGLSASGIWWLVLSSLVASILGSARIGAAVSLLTGFTLVVAATGFVSGRLQPAIDANLYQRLASSWLAVIFVTGIFAAMVMHALGGYTRASARLLERMKTQRDEIERLSLLDPLTSLPLATLATDRMQMALHAARRAGMKLAVLYIDLDGFKAVNDNLGHDAGDVVLAECALRMQHAVRSEDTIARVGGDEFLAVIGTLTAADDAVLVAEKLLQALVAPLVFEGRLVKIGASIGIAVYPDHAPDVAGLRRRADLAMYRAKREGGSSIAFATAEIQSDIPDVATDVVVAGQASGSRREAIEE